MTQDFRLETPETRMSRGRVSSVWASNGEFRQFTWLARIWNWFVGATSPVFAKSWQECGNRHNMERVRQLAAR